MGTYLPPGFPTNIPDWMIIFSTIISLIWTFLAIVELIHKTIRGANIEFRLTREIVLRILKEGECFYANGVFISYFGGALIDDVKATLIKTDNAKKEFPLSIIKYGEKYRNNEGLEKYYFHTTSPLEFVPNNLPKRIVYLCAQKTYSDKFAENDSNFILALDKIKEEYSSKLNDLVKYDSKVVGSEMQKKVEEITNNVLNELMDAIQIEKGNYNFIMTIRYHQKGKIIPSFKKKETTSSITFVIDDHVRDKIRYKLKEYLEKLSLNIVLNQSEKLEFPEYIPIQVAELKTDSSNRSNT